MVRKTRRLRNTSKKILDIWNNKETIWGKNPALEIFWSDLASGKHAIIIYKDSSHKYVKLPKRMTPKYQSTMSGFDEDKDIVAVLSSNPSQDAYEQYLYPKAKNSSVDSVIKNYKKYFKPILPGAKLRVPL